MANCNPGARVQSTFGSAYRLRSVAKQFRPTRNVAARCGIGKGSSTQQPGGMFAKARKSRSSAPVMQNGARPTSFHVVMVGKSRSLSVWIRGRDQPQF
jgi:hypothetical protein